MATPIGNTLNSAFYSTTFDVSGSVKVDEPITAASIAPSGRDVVLASRDGLFIIDLDNLTTQVPRHIVNRSDWEVVDIQWSPFASRAGWIAATCNQKALIYNLDMSFSDSKAPIEHVLHAHTRMITDINFSAHDPDILATCAVDSFVYSWDLRAPVRPATSFSTVRQNPMMRFGDFTAGATQVKFNRKNSNIIASSHDRLLHIWDQRNGAKPLTTIEAHSTKIYGIDWHRANANKILTCSLDKTIKLWDYEKNMPDQNPLIENQSDGEKKKDTVKRGPLVRTIRTEYPLKRARHTPFPNGILAMPQLGSSALQLYTCKGPQTEDDNTTTPPAHSFEAHHEGTSVREFLWRSRGGADNGIDNREFQLVSWGDDKYLRLHSIPDDLLFRTVGFKKGWHVIEEPSTTRRGAKYITYQNSPSNLPPIVRRAANVTSQPRGNLSSLLQNADLNETNSSLFAGDNQRTTMTAARVGRNSDLRVVSQIKWMDGVTIGERRDHPDGERLPSPAPKTLENELIAEISSVGKQYTKVSFELIDVPGRRVIVSFFSPWGEEDMSDDKKTDRKLVFLRFVITFPVRYPRVIPTPHDTERIERQTNPLKIECEKTTAAINDKTLEELKAGMQEIADHYAKAGRESLEAVLCYALGERALEESKIVSVEPGKAEEGHNIPGAIGVGQDSSSEDEDDADGTENDIMNSSHANANIPLPIQCTARFSACGSLAMTKIPSAVPPRSLVSDPTHTSLTRKTIFDTFGRISKAQRNCATDSANGAGSPSSSIGSWESSSSTSSSSESDNEAGAPRGRFDLFQPPIAWQKATLRFQNKQSHPSSASLPKPPKPKSIVSILRSSVEDLIPSKRVFAEEYKIFGDGPSVCFHNAMVARKFGFEDIATVWEFCKLILNNQVPLDILPQQHRREQVLVLARRALVRIKRKDSGLDLRFDEADTVTNPKLKGRVKWGHHSVVTFLIPALFEHFEKLADTQMLAMLSCIFSEPAAHEGIASTVQKMRQPNLPMSMEAPAFSLDYFSSADAAWSLFKPTISNPSTPAHSRYATPVNELGWNRFTKTLDTYGSHGSSNGPWESGTLPSEPVTPYSTGNTPPNVSRVPTLRSMTSHTPFSSSPEQQQTAKKFTSANFASAFASLSRPFSNAASSSPPVKTRNDGDLSTSAPTSGITWGTTTFYSSGSNERNPAPLRMKHGKRASFGQTDHINIDYYSDSDSDYHDDDLTLDGASEYTTPLTPGESEEEGEGTIKVTLKNQDQFDDDACVSAPLLNMGKEWLYRAWREQYAEMLGCWGLITKRAEVLKFNGLVSYFPPENGRQGFRAESTHLWLRGDEAENSN
ncbi:hypothetical protein K469DRAFT_387430 [Zopfia rhizophila CBS 207.26]|uniref:Uncharacterized protein n=1 Tax=Zopfia rhizophila CBS 207.26 TaxID=1314779 RepID=A0A6A6EKW8_9PEZI|nr:hypothetical protein K469DRAFT_387430 [Zopfia rhizophila CBS 207.26]